jgi:hypothetical protein
MQVRARDSSSPFSSAAERLYAIADEAMRVLSIAELSGLRKWKSDQAEHKLNP